MTPRRKNLIFAFLALSLVIVSFGSGFLLGQTQVVCEVCPPQDLDFSLFWQSYRLLKEKFVNPQKIDEQKIIYGAIAGMVNSLEDPYTVFLNPQETHQFMEDISGRFEGVGMEIGIRDKSLRVIAPLEDTPAQKAGLRPGDKIIKIDDTATTDITLEEAVSLIRGPKGTTVRLTIARESDGLEKIQEFKITRGSIEIPSLRWELIQEDIAHIKLYQFNQKADLDFTRAAIEILASPARTIILDLRNNPGGYLEVARDIAEWFLARGELVVIEDSGKGKKEYRSRGEPVFLDYPVVILINQGSASGSEILAGALKDNRNVLLIGETSFGKGSVQQLEQLRENASLKITTARWLTPKGTIINEIGLEPDIKIEMTEEDYLAGRDPQLEEAIRQIKSL